MKQLEPFQLQRLAAHPDIPDNMERLSQDEYNADVEWISAHFTFTWSQMLDRSTDPMAIVGTVDALEDDGLLAFLQQYEVMPSRQVHVIWAYGDFGVALPLRLVSKYLTQEIWYPATDDVFILDPADNWCAELHHEGEFIIMRGKVTREQTMSWRAVVKNGSVRRVHEGVVPDTLVAHVPGWDALREKGYGWREYGANLCDIAQVLACAALFWPTLVEDDGCLLWEAADKPSQMATLRTLYGPDKAQIEREFNMHRIVDLFFPRTEEASNLLGNTDLLDALGVALKRFWEVRLRTLFPGRVYVVELGTAIGEEGLSITFFERR